VTDSSEIFPNKNGIGTLAEMSLHAGLKRWYSQPGDEVEMRVDGYVVDIVRGDLLIEIQTRNFSALKRKLTRLLETHTVRLVYPIAKEKWIVKDPGLTPTPGVESGQVAERRAAYAGGTKNRRKSPRRGQWEHVFVELVRIPLLALHPNFTLEVVLTREEEIQALDGRGSWRRKGWSIYDRRLIGVVERRTFSAAADYLALLPPGLPHPFTTRDLARGMGQPRYLAQKMVYCLREMGALRPAGKRGKSYLYEEVYDEKQES